MAIQKESEKVKFGSSNERSEVMRSVEGDVNRWTARVMELELQLRQARAEERRARARFYQIQESSQEG